MANHIRYRVRNTCNTWKFTSSSIISDKSDTPDKSDKSDQIRLLESISVPILILALSFNLGITAINVSKCAITSSLDPSDINK